MPAAPCFVLKQISIMYISSIFLFLPVEQAGTPVRLFHMSIVYIIWVFLRLTKFLFDYLQFSRKVAPLYSLHALLRRPNTTILLRNIEIKFSGARARGWIYISSIQRESHLIILLRIELNDRIRSDKFMMQFLRTSLFLTNKAGVVFKNVAWIGEKLSVRVAIKKRLRS